jgi:PIN domain nuclease of toxin-antitoxin system
MLLLDTHVLIWLNLEPRKLSKAAADAIRQARAQSSIAIADITLWEVAWLSGRNRITIFGSVETFIREAVTGVVVHPVTPEIASLSVQLPPTVPRDPSDRLIVSTARAHGIPLVTADESIRLSQTVSVIW